MVERSLFLGSDSGQQQGLEHRGNSSNYLWSGLSCVSSYRSFLSFCALQSVKLEPLLGRYFLMSQTCLPRPSAPPSQARLRVNPLHPSLSTG